MMPFACSPTPLKVSGLPISISRAIIGGAVVTCGLQPLSADTAKEAAAEAAYIWQREALVRLNPELASLLGHQRWPCFWGEEYTGDLSAGQKGYGYRTCGLRHLLDSNVDKQCVVYSFGCDGDYDFERKIASIHGRGCEIHIFDPDDLKGGYEAFEEAFAGIAATVQYHRMALLDRDEKQSMASWPHVPAATMHTHTLPSIMRWLGHTHIDVLKIDIEGNEHRVFAHLAEVGWPSIPGQLYMEAHSSPSFPPHEAVHIRRLIETMEKAGLRLFNAERPWRWCQSSCVQLSFIHREWHPETVVYPAPLGWLRDSYDCRHEGWQIMYQIHWNGTNPSREDPASQGIVVQRPHVSFPMVAPGAWFTVTWGIVNTGIVPMLVGCCSVVKVDGTAGWRRPGASIGVDVQQDGEGETIAGESAPGQRFVQSMELVAPLGPPGRHWSHWRIRTRAGSFIGEKFEIAVHVVPKQPG